MTNKNFDDMQAAYGDAINARIEELADELETIIQEASEHIRPYEAERIASLFVHYAQSAYNSCRAEKAIGTAADYIANYKE